MTTLENADGFLSHLTLPWNCLSFWEPEAQQEQGRAASRANTHQGSSLEVDVGEQQAQGQPEQLHETHSQNKVLRAGGIALQERFSAICEILGVMHSAVQNKNNEVARLSSALHLIERQTAT